MSAAKKGGSGFDRVAVLNWGSLALAAMGVIVLLVCLAGRDDRAVVGELHNDAEALLSANPDAALVTVEGPKGARFQRALLCFDGFESSEALFQSTGGLNAVWIDSAGGRLGEVAIGDLNAAPRYGDDRRCVSLPPTTIDSPGLFHLVLEVADDQEPPDQLAGTQVRAMAIDAVPVRMLERLAIVAILLAMVGRLASWQLRRPSGPRDLGRWSAVDPLLGVVGVLVIASVIGTALRPPKNESLASFTDSSTMAGIEAGTHALGSFSAFTFAALVANIAVYVGIAWLIARWRSKGPATALKLTRSLKIGLGWPSVAGLGMALGATLMLASVQPDQASPMQWITMIPGTMLATAAMASLSPWFEEVFFRGFLFGSVEGVSNRKVAAAITFGLFALAHVPQHLGFLAPMFPIIAVAAAATLLRYISGSAAPSFALHLSYNALLVTPILFV